MTGPGHILAAILRKTCTVSLKVAMEAVGAELGLGLIGLLTFPVLPRRFWIPDDLIAYDFLGSCDLQKLEVSSAEASSM
jgi:hypothetical protein